MPDKAPSTVATASRCRAHARIVAGSPTAFSFSRCPARRWRASAPMSRCFAAARLSAPVCGSG
jgi:hypothetical protein